MYSVSRKGARLSNFDAITYFSTIVMVVLAPAAEPENAPFVVCVSSSTRPIDHAKFMNEFLGVNVYHDSPTRQWVPRTAVAFTRRNAPSSGHACIDIICPDGIRSRTFVDNHADICVVLREVLRRVSVPADKNTMVRVRFDAFNIPAHYSVINVHDINLVGDDFLTGVCAMVCIGPGISLMAGRWSQHGFAPAIGHRACIVTQTSYTGRAVMEHRLILSSGEDVPAFTTESTNGTRLALANLEASERVVLGTNDEVEHTPPERDENDEPVPKSPRRV